MAGQPWWALLLLMVAMPVAVALFFGLFAFRTMTPLAFRCVRCGTEFRGKPWRRMPATCPSCRARDWNAPQG